MIQRTLPTTSAAQASSMMDSLSSTLGPMRAVESVGGRFHLQLSRAAGTLNSSRSTTAGKNGRVAGKQSGNTPGRASRDTSRDDSGGKVARNPDDVFHGDDQGHTDDQDATQSSDDSTSGDGSKAKASDKKSGSSNDSMDGTGGQGFATQGTPNPDSSSDDGPAETGDGAEATAAADSVLPAATDASETDATANSKSEPTVKNAADNGTDFLHLVAQAGAESASSKPSDAQSLAPAPLPGPPQTAATDQDPNIARVARGLQNALQQNGGSVTLRLQPPDLGSVKIQMDIHDGMASVEFQTDRPAVSDLLGHQLSSLRDALQTHGLTVDKMEVRTAAPTFSGGTGQQADGSPGDGRSQGEFFTRQQPGTVSQQGGDAADGQSFDEAMVNAVA